MSGPWAIAAVAATLCAEPFDLPPQALALPAYRVHLMARDEVEPDLLGALGRPGAVLWLRTQSNTLRASVLERVARFNEAYVELRPPLLEHEVRALGAAPRAGAWLDESALGDGSLFRLGARRRAVEIRGPLTEERAQRTRAARPARIRWRPDAIPSLDEWGRFAQLPGGRVLVWDGPLLRADGGCPVPGRWEGLALWADSPRWGAPAALASVCGWGLWVRLPAAASDAWLSSLFAKDPGVELELDVPNDAMAVAARGLLQRVEAAAPRSGR